MGLLVFGDDGSPAADVAWLWVCNHPWNGWRVDVLTAAPPPLLHPAAEQAPAAVEWESPHARRPVEGSGFVSLRHLGHAVDPRLALGARSDADLLVVGPQGRGRAERLLVGSTTEWLLHHPPAPTAVVRSATAVQRVIVCVDGSDHALAAARAYAALPLAASAQATLVAVDDGRCRPQAAIDAARVALAPTGQVPYALERRGPVTAAILDSAAELDAQLIVMGTRGLTGWARLRLGSTAGAVVRSTTRSMLVASADSDE